MTIKWNIAKYQSNVSYSVGTEMIYNIKVLNSNLCDYNDAYNLVRGDIITTSYNQVTLETFKIVDFLIRVSQKLLKQQ